MAKRFTERIGVAFEPEMADKIKALRERFGLKFGEVVRECVEHELPKLISASRATTETRTRSIQTTLNPMPRLGLWHSHDS